MTYANDLENKTKELMDGALQVANGDTALAFHVLATKTGELLVFTNELQAKNEVCEKEVVRLRNIVGEDEDSFFEKLFDSNVSKVIIFGTGVYIGYELAN